MIRAWQGHMVTMGPSGKPMTARETWKEESRIARIWLRYWSRATEQVDTRPDALYLGAWLRFETYWSLNLRRSTIRGLGILLGWHGITWRLDDEVLSQVQAFSRHMEWPDLFRGCELELARRRNPFYRYWNALRRRAVIAFEMA